MKQINIDLDFENKLRKITSNFGISTQLIKLNEEMGELLNEGYYGIYEGNNKNSLEDECADVLNVLIQIMLFFDLDWKEIEKRMEYKVNRCIDRLENTDYYKSHTR